MVPLVLESILAVLYQSFHCVGHLLYEHSTEKNEKSIADPQQAVASVFHEENPPPQRCEEGIIEGIIERIYFLNAYTL